jgi:membrane protease YdiL (CAAX protease family)
MLAPMTSPSAWTWPRIIGYTLLIAIVYIVAQTGAVIAAAVVQAILVPGFQLEPWLERVGSDGLAVMAGLFASTLLCVPLVWILVRRHESVPWAFLGMRPVAAKTVGMACAATLLFVAVTDTVNVWLLDRPLVPPFMTETYATAPAPVMLFVTMVVFAPLTEELMFRGFLYGALEAKGLTAPWCVAASSLAFTLVHLQYDLHDMTLVLLMALLLGGTRARFRSIVPTIAMHALLNAVAFVETTLVSG